MDSNWINQTEGEINLHMEGIDIGTQPIRVVHAISIYFYQRTNPEFFQELLSGTSAGDNIEIILGAEPITIGDGCYRTPRIHLDSKKIELHETFLSYLWCSIYSLFVIHSETIDYPGINSRLGRIKYPVSEENIVSAKELFNYAKYLIRDFVEWDRKSLPNPEIFQAENRHYIRQTCAFYTEAIKFILCHEYTHLRDHQDKFNNNAPPSHFLEFEMEADNNAIDMMKKGITQINQLAVENGIIFGILSMFFFSASTKGIRHPNVEDRLTNAINRLDLTDNPYPWEIACVAFKLWDEQFALNLNWKDLPSYQDKFHDIIQQIKEREI